MMARLSHLHFILITLFTVNIILLWRKRVIRTFNECHLDCLKRITKTGNESNRSNICDNEEPQQKVISFSYFGNRFRKVFVKGIAENLKLMRNLYRGWRMRLYLNKLKISMEAGVVMEFLRMKKLT